MIDKIIDECLKNKELNKCKSDVEFYEECRNKFTKLKNKGLDFSKCHCFGDLCKVSNDYFLKGLMIN